MAAPAFVGVDNGGTWIRLVGLDGKSRRVWSLKKPSPTVPDLPAFLRRHLKRFHGKLEGLAVGSRGVWKTAARKALWRKLEGMAKCVVVMSDVEAAWMAAFAGTRVERRGTSPSKNLVPRPSSLNSGIVVIAGTGSIAYGRTTTGRFARAGGLGPEKGDEGSGYWIGKEWLRRKHKFPTFKKTRVRSIAGLAPAVLRRAREGNTIALEIVREAQWELGQLVRTLARELQLAPVPVACAGSILQDPWFRKSFKRTLSPLRVVFHMPRTDTATALAKSIM